VKNMVDLL